jgi:hypothetical protein
MYFQRILAFTFVTFLLVAPALVIAQGNFDPRAITQNSREGLVPCDGVNCTCKDLATLANRVLTFTIYVLIFLSAITFSYAGFQYLTAGGDSGKVSHASNMLKDVAKGMGVALIAWLVVDTLVKTLTKPAIYNVWSQICG